MENETSSKLVCPDDDIEHTADKAHPQSDGEAPFMGRKVPSVWDAVLSEPSSKQESDIDLNVEGGG